MDGLLTWLGRITGIAGALRLVSRGIGEPRGTSVGQFLARRLPGRYSVAGRLGHDDFRLPLLARPAFGPRRPLRLNRPTQFRPGWRASALPIRGRA